MWQRFIDWLVKLLLASFDLERKSKRDQEEKEAADANVARGDAAAAVPDGVPERDKYARD